MSKPELVEPSKEKSIILKPTPGSSKDSENALAILNWISDELTILAEAFGEPLTEERLDIYARDLADIPRDYLEVSFQRARRELSWFPKLAELRNLAGAKADDRSKVEAHAAWDHVNEYLRKWGVERLPVYSSGRKITAPRLDVRTEYALRRIGGLPALNQVDVEKWPFMYRDFCEAYLLAPVAELMAPQLIQQFGKAKLAGKVKQLIEAKAMDQQTNVQEVGRAMTIAPEIDEPPPPGLESEKISDPVEGLGEKLL